MTQTPFRALLAFLITTVACSPEPGRSGGDTVLLQTVRPDLRIAVVGAGASGLTAALTLKDLGYRNVTVFEKEGDVGGKIHSFKLGDLRAELGAVFASPDYKTVLGLADRFAVPYVRYEGPRLVMDEKGVKRSFQDFLLSRYSADQIRQAAQNYLGVLQRFPEIDQDGFANLPSELTMNFDKFAARFGFTPVAELARSLLTGFGYDTYETVPAAYVLKLLPWLVKVGPAGLESPPYSVFPDGYQALWRAVAGALDVKLNSAVTKIERPGVGRPLRVTVQGGARREFDAVVISTPLDVVPKFLAVTPEERALFGQISTSRYFVTLFFSLNLAQAETVFIHPHAFPDKINHVSVWGNPGGNAPVFIGYQLADQKQNAATLFGTLALDVFQLGHGLFTVPLYQREWAYFPRVGSQAMRDGYFDDLAALQGKDGIYYVGSSLSFETVEHTSRFARTLMLRRFGAGQ
jgi:oxygen-dependent protoporphyrinogen oxidase